MDGAHWYRNMRQTVRFAPAIEGLLRDGSRTFIEVSPHPVLAFGIETTAEAVLGEPGRIAALATLRRDQGGPQRFAASLAELHVRGGRVDWSAQLGARAARRLRLPTYAFQRERHWLDAAAPATAVAATGAPRTRARAEAAARRRRRPADSSFAARVAGMAEGERAQAVQDAVLRNVAAVLGHASAAEVDGRLAFKELGFDSPATVELRNRINRPDRAAARRRSVLFDNPTPAGLAERVLAELTGGGGERPGLRGGGARGRADRDRRDGVPVSGRGGLC